MAIGAAAMMAAPEAAHAAENAVRDANGTTRAHAATRPNPDATHQHETAPTAALQTSSLVPLLNSLFATIDSYGSLGPLVLFLVVLAAEMLPLVPTQPLYLSAGLIFGNEGLLPAWGGTVAAAGLAYAVARTLGRPGGALSGLVAFVFEREGDSEDSANGLKAQLEGLAEEGFAASFAKVVLLRLSPVVPYSISNYASGLVGLRFVPFFAGTALGMLPWALVWTTLGGTGHAALVQGSGSNFTELLGGALAQAQELAESPAARAVALGATGSLVAFAVYSARQGRNSGAAP